MTPGQYSLPLLVVPLIAVAAITLGLGLYALRKRLRHRHLILPVAREAIFEAMGDGVLVLDRTRRIIDINPAASGVLGLTSAASIGQPLERVLPDLSDIEQERTELSIEHADGARRYDVQLSAVHQRDGELAGYLVVLRDVSALRLSQERFRAHFHN